MFLLVPAYPGSPGQKAVKRLCVCVCVCVCVLASATTTLCQPSTSATFAKRAYRCCAQAVWISLPKTVVNSDSVTVSTLKTLLFARAFSLPYS